MTNAARLEALQRDAKYVNPVVIKVIAVLRVVRRGHRRGAAAQPSHSRPSDGLPATGRLQENDRNVLAGRFVRESDGRVGRQNGGDEVIGLCPVEGDGCTRSGSLRRLDKPISDCYGRSWRAATDQRTIDSIADVKLERAGGSGVGETVTNEDVVRAGGDIAAIAQEDVICACGKRIAGAYTNGGVVVCSAACVVEVPERKVTDSGVAISGCVGGKHRKANARISSACRVS